MCFKQFKRAVAQKSKVSRNVIIVLSYIVFPTSSLHNIL